MTRKEARSLDDAERATSKSLETGRYVSAKSDQKSAKWRITTIGIQNPLKDQESK